jgi:hypothetical protein
VNAWNDLEPFAMSVSRGPFVRADINRKSSEVDTKAICASTGLVEPGRAYSGSSPLAPVIDAPGNPIATSRLTGSQPGNSPPSSNSTVRQAPPPATAQPSRPPTPYLADAPSKAVPLGARYVADAASKTYAPMSCGDVVAGFTTENRYYYQTEAAAQADGYAFDKRCM